MAVAAAMLLSFIESLLPAFVPIPGIKIGLANIAVIFILYDKGAPSAAAVSLVRVFLVALLFGSFVSMVYGLAGAVVSLAVMVLLKKITPLSQIGVSVAGGVAHNMAQIGIACLIMGSARVLYYLPFLILSGTLSGIAIGVASGLLVKRLGKT